jgi:hypothetical protein
VDRSRRRHHPCGADRYRKDAPRQRARRGGGAPAQTFLTERYERRSVIVTTNLAFSEWVKVFGGDEKLTTALLDRLAHHATVITTKGKSFRMRKKGLPEASDDGASTTPVTLPKAARKA